MGLNQWAGIGRLTRDPELRYTGDGTAVTNFTIAVNNNFGEAEKVDFIPVVCWRGTAEAVASYLIKGALVGVSGRLQIRKYENKDQETRTIAEIVADTVQFLEKPKPQDQEPEPPIPTNTPAPAPAAKRPAPTKRPAPARAR